MRKLSTKKKAIGRKPDPADDIFEAWHAFYRLGDEALARMRDGAQKGDMRAVREASKSVEMVRDAMRALPATLMGPRPLKSTRPESGTSVPSCPSAHAGAPNQFD